MLDAMKLGANLRAARDRSGLSQDWVARSLGLPRTAITNIESGARMVSTLELTKLAEMYRESPAAFLGDGAAGEELSVVLPRALPSLLQSPDMQEALGRILDLCRDGAALRILLDQVTDPTLPRYVARPQTVGDAIRQAETVAQEERRRLGLGTAPIGNIAELIASQGVWTAAAHLQDELSGLFIHHPSIGLAVLVNAGHHPVRKRFSYAHEYAHALFDRDLTVVTTERRNASDLIETRANAFAAAFLMPADGINDQLRQVDKGGSSRQAQILFSVAGDEPMEAEIRPRPGSQSITYQDVAALARHFGVSYPAMVWRLKSIEKIRPAEASSLIDQREIGNRYGRILWTSTEEEVPPADMRHEHRREIRTQIVRLAIEAFRRGAISGGRLREIGSRLEIGADDLAELAAAVRPE